MIGLYYIWKVNHAEDKILVYYFQFAYRVSMVQLSRLNILRAKPKDLHYSFYLLYFIYQVSFFYSLILALQQPYNILVEIYLCFWVAYLTFFIESPVFLMAEKTLVKDRGLHL